MTDKDVEAVEMFKKVIDLNPDFYAATSDLQIAYERLGEKEKLQEALDQALHIYAGYLSRHPDDARAHMFYAANLAQVGRKEEGKVVAAKAIALSPGDSVMMYNAACFYAVLGEKKLAIESLKNSISSGNENYEWLRRDPDLDCIREEPEYIELMKGK